MNIPVSFVLITFLLGGVPAMAVADSGALPQRGHAETYSALTGTRLIKHLPDKKWVALEGYITHQIDHEHYSFSDDSGTVIVDIEDETWLNEKVFPEDRVRLEGFIDNYKDRPEIKVNHIMVVK
jgi:uncharacterized protein (TIGR00156 family)